MSITDILKPKSKEIAKILPICEIIPNPLQPRRSFDEEELNALSKSIKQFGLIQPIAVKRLDPLPFPMPQPKAKYEIIAGERRWRASRMAGLTEIPCIIRDSDLQQSAFLALIENLQRSDLSYFEEALAMQNLLLISGQTQTELAASLAISQSALSNKLRLLRLTERERLMAAENGFSERQARALVRIDSERERRPIMLEIIKNKLSASETEALIEDYLSQPAHRQSTKKKRQRSLKGSLDIRFFFNTLEKSLKLLNSSGMNTQYTKSEQDNSVTLVITIEKLR